MAETLYVDTSVLLAAFSNEPAQPAALAVLQSLQWAQVCVSDWTLAEFACALHAKVLRGETSPQLAHTITQTLADLVQQNALRHIAVLREDYAAVQRMVSSLNCLVRGADALHLAVSARSGCTHLASLDKAQRVAAAHWMNTVICVP